jgi:uncharacterized protein
MASPYHDGRMWKDRTRAALAALFVLPPLAVIAAGQGARQAGLFAIAIGLGLALVLGSFSFAGGFRRLLAEGRGAGFRAQLVLIGLTACLFAPLLADGVGRGFVFPTGLALLLGAFLFGIGMQIGGGCGSGTLAAAGAGQGSRMWVTLAAFIAGATLASMDSRWTEWPALPPISLPDALGRGPALALSLALLAAAFLASRAAERARHGTAEALPLAATPGALWRGPWPLLWGALALAVLNLATLWLGGRPWAIVAAFPLWGAKAVEASGFDDPAFWPFWEDPTRAEALLRPLLADRLTVMNCGVLAGAFLAATLAARRLDLGWPGLRPMAAAVLGGLLLGVGGVMASGCNISAYLGGIASGSLHGWVWIFPALIGNWVGLKLRPLFALS